MTTEILTTLPPADVLARATRFFADRVPAMAAFPERVGPTWLTLRGQGGEEIALSATPAGSHTRVRASTLFFVQPVARFLDTLPRAEASEASEAPAA
jgi:hypothetical protein